jgi:hypothetical protein
MRTSIPNTGDSDGSPCRACPNHLAGINKELCLNECKRLATYRDGRDWRKEEIFIMAVGKALTEDMELPDDLVGLEVGKDEENDIGLEVDQGKLPGAVTHITPETNWKKAMPPKPEAEKPIQNICIMDGCDRIARLRGCCRQCYHLWRSGLLSHPVVGAFRKMATTEIRQARLKKTGKGSVVDKDIKQTRTVVGYDNTTKIATVGHPEVAEDMTPTPWIININFMQYQYLFSKIRKEADRLSLPVTHVIMTMLGEMMIKINRMEASSYENSIK